MINEIINERIVSRVQQAFPEGTRIILLEMGEDTNPIPDGVRGTVEFVDDIGTVFCKFDNGRNLGLAYGIDRYRKLTTSELYEERKFRKYGKI